MGLFSLKHFTGSNAVTWLQVGEGVVVDGLPGYSTLGLVCAVMQVGEGVMVDGLAGAHAVAVSTDGG